MSLFLGLFSRFDAFIGQLIQGLYDLRPELFKSLGGSIEISDVLSTGSLESLKNKILDDQIETLRRKSYPEQFASLETRFGITTLTKFPSWKYFVEISQRRNLLTHCDGFVSEQYAEVCSGAGLKADDLAAVGSKVNLGQDYFASACGIVMEVGIKLGQTLWRKTIPDQHRTANSHLNSLLFDALDANDVPRAKLIGEFSMSLKISSDIDHRVMLINYAQALKRGGSAEAARTLVNSTDWSAVTNDFKLARAVLIDDEGEAVAMMTRIGKNGDLLSETSYHTWPLFNEFRETNAFLKTYEEIYGYPYISKLKADAATLSEAGSAEDAAILESPSTTIQ